MKLCASATLAASVISLKFALLDPDELVPWCNKNLVFLSLHQGGKVILLFNLLAFQEGINLFLEQFLQKNQAGKKLD